MIDPHIRSGLDIEPEIPHAFLKDANILQFRFFGFQQLFQRRKLRCGLVLMRVQQRLQLCVHIIRLYLHCFVQISHPLLFRPSLLCKFQIIVCCFRLCIHRPEHCCMLCHKLLLQTVEALPIDYFICVLLQKFLELQHQFFCAHTILMHATVPAFLLYRVC